MKKMGFLLLCLGFLGMAACGIKEGNEGTQDTEEAERGSGGEQNILADGGAAPEKVIMAYQVTSDSIIDDLEDVERAVNEISVPEIGVEVEFKVIDAGEAISRYPLWISNKEPVDLMVLNYQDITQYVNRDMLRSLDDILYEYAPAIRTVMEERYDLTQGAVLDHFTYGIAVAQAYRAVGRGMILPKRYVEETGLTYDPKYVYTLEELTEWLAALKKLYPDRYPLGLLTAENSFSIQSFFMDVGEGIGGESTSGNLLDTAEMKVYDRYASEGYREFLACVRQWYEQGFLYPDGALTDYTIEELVSLGLICSYPGFSTPESIENGCFPEEMVCLRTTQVSISPQNSKSGFWVIPATSGHADAAMKFLDLMYADEAVVNLIQWGIEGRHYEVTDREKGLISWPAGQEGPAGYFNPLGLYGDRGKTYEMCSPETRSQREAYEREAVQRGEEAEGFVYSSVNVSGELDRIQKVITKYVPILESGSVDLDRYYPEFLEELERAGMETVIADKQRQLDAWFHGK